MADLACYRLKRELGGVPIHDFDQVVDSPDEYQQYGPEDFGQFSAKLYVRNIPPHPLPWQGFLRDGFGEDVDLPHVASVGALVVIVLGEAGGMFAIPFGTTGRHMLRDGVYQRNFGLKVALNLVFTGGGEEEAEATSRIQSLDTTRLGTTTLKARKQASRVSSLESFEVDRIREMLRNLVVRPADPEAWGSRVVGGDAAKVARSIDFGDIGDFCTQVAATADRTDYRERVPWVDDLRLVQDREEIDRVEGAIEERLRTGNPNGEFVLSPPEILEWEGLAGFELPGEGGRGRRRAIRRPDVDLEHVLTDDLRQMLDRALLQRRRLRAVNGDGIDLGRWSLWRCLAGAIEVDGLLYVMDDGDVFEVDRSYLQTIDRTIESLPESAVQLEACLGGIREDEYNLRCAEVNDQLVVLDKKLLIEGRSTRLEVCDLLSLDRQLVHVKREVSADGLSHLFSQGQASAQVLNELPAFREMAADQCRRQGSDRHAALFEGTTFRAADWEVSYAVIAPWRGRTAIEAIPFFSKLTLVHAVNNLRGWGFNVSLKRVEREAFTTP